MNFTASINLPQPNELAAIVTSMPQERLNRYRRPITLSDEEAFKVFLWNAALCQAFLLPLQLAEVSCRNAIQHSLRKHFGSTWYLNKKFTSLLNAKLAEDLEKVCKDEEKRHVKDFSDNHVVSALSFGFWRTIATKKFKGTVWSEGARGVFPHIPDHLSIHDIYNYLNELRKFRNRIAHHNAIFDQKPEQCHLKMLEMIGWSCPTTKTWLERESSVPRVLTQGPPRKARKHD